jgi:hypothetical protein
MNIGHIMMLIGELLIGAGIGVAVIGVSIYFYLKGLK